MNQHLITADRIWDGTGSTTRARPIVKIIGDRIESVETSLLVPQTCSGEIADFPPGHKRMYFSKTLEAR